MNKRQQYAARAHEHYLRNMERSVSEYAEHVIVLPESRRWDYALPENYTNYQDGFIVQDGDPYRGRPFLNYNGKILYLFRSIGFSDLRDDESEKLLLFDRTGRKYTFIVTKEDPTPGGNPSYFPFLPRVKKYAPTRAETIQTRLLESRAKMQSYNKNAE